MQKPVQEGNGMQNKHINQEHQPINLQQHKHSQHSQQNQPADAITKDTTIGDIVSNHPEAVEPLTAAGVHCVGCHVSPYETLEQGLKSHGMSDAAVIGVINKLNEAINKKSHSEEKLTLTQSAAKKIQQLSKSNQQGLNIQVTPGGCSGYQYEFLIAKPSQEDKIIESNGAKIFVNPKTLSLIAGSEIDYIEALQGAGFKVQNPKASSTCGCGSSFS